MTDVISQVHLNMKLTVQLESHMRDTEPATYCTLFLQKGNDIVKEMQDAGRAYNELVTYQPSVERGSPRIWFFNAMLKTFGKTLTNNIENGGLSLLDQVKAEAKNTIRINTTFIDLNTWVKTCRHLSSNAKPGQHGAKGRSRTRTERILHWRRWKRSRQRKMATKGGG